jgi:hypothetical protein
MGCHTEILRKDYLEHLKQEAFKHSVEFIEGQNKKNEQIDNLKEEIKSMKAECELKFEELFRYIRNRQRTEENKLAANNIDPAPRQQRKSSDSFNISKSSDDNQSIEDYDSDEFESDYSFGFRNLSGRIVLNVNRLNCDD